MSQSIDEILTDHGIFMLNTSDGGVREATLTKKQAKVQLLQR